MPKTKQSPEADLNVDSLLDLLNGEDEQMQTLFAKTINLYVAPGTDQMSDAEKIAHLREAIEQSLE